MSMESRSPKPRRRKPPDVFTRLLMVALDDGKIPATGLTQAQLDTACANPKTPPMLEGLMDAETGEPLVWRGKPLGDGE